MIQTNFLDIFLKLKFLRDRNFICEVILTLSKCIQKIKCKKKNTNN